MVNTVRNIFLVHRMFKLWKQVLQKKQKEILANKFILREQIDWEEFLIRRKN